MKPIYATALLFLFGNEVVSWIVLAVLAWYGLIQFLKEVPHD